MHPPGRAITAAESAAIFGLRCKVIRIRSSSHVVTSSESYPRHIRSFGAQFRYCPEHPASPAQQLGRPVQPATEAMAFAFGGGTSRLIRSKVSADCLQQRSEWARFACRLWAEPGGFVTFRKHAGVPLWTACRRIRPGTPPYHPSQPAAKLRPLMHRNYADACLPFPQASSPFGSTASTVRSGSSYCHTVRNALRH